MDEDVRARRIGFAVAMLFIVSPLIGSSTIPGRKYVYDIIAATGMTPANAPSVLTGMGDNPSINASGVVAFVGQFATGQGLVVGNASKPLTLINPGFVTGSRQFGRATQINDAGKIMASDFVSGAPPVYFERLWDSTKLNSFNVLAFGGPNQAFDAVFNQGSVNNNGDAAFGALLGTQTLLVSVSQGVTNQLPMPANSLPRPMIADNKNIVIRFGNQSNSPILLFDATLKQPVAAIAGSSFFNTTGNEPGISDEGHVVSFYGDLNAAGAQALGLQPGPGIFANIDLGNGTRSVINIANSQSFSSFDANNRVAVTDLDLGVPGIEGDTFVVAFVATDLSGNQGLWTSRVDVIGSVSKGTLSFNVKTPNLAVEVGDMIGTAVISSITLFDPISHTGSGLAGDHTLGFWANTSSGPTIIRANFLPCETNVNPQWSQGDPQWATSDYDHSYRTQVYSGTAPVSASGTMDFVVGSQHYGVNLLAGGANANNVKGLASALNALGAGVFAIVQPSNYLSVYHTACLQAGCSPRSSNTLQLCEVSCMTGANILQPRTIQQVGCLLTCMAMGLHSVGVNNINTIASGQTVPLALTPFTLNEFMSNTLSLSGIGGRFNSTGDVRFDLTPSFVGTNIAKPNLMFDASGGGQDSTVNLTNAQKAVTNAVCTQGLPIIVGVQSPLTNAYPGHYVLVTAQRGTATDGSEYLIADPGYSSNTSLADYNNEYLTVGVVKDPNDVSQISIDVGDAATLMVIDSAGRRTGFDPSSGTVLQEIPSSSYIASKADDDVTPLISGVDHSIQILTPAQGTYTLMLTGLNTGPYILSAIIVAQDGTIQPELMLIGNANPGSTVMVQYNVATTGGNPSTMQVAVPNVVGLTQASATTLITGAGLVVGTLTNIASNTVPAGDVISETPTAGTLVSAGSPVNLVISTGPAQVAVPNVVGLTQAAATTAITGAGLVLGTVTTASSNAVLAGNVISESPVAGTMVNSGSAVNLVVSSGPAQVAVPNVVGLTQAAATTAITGAGLVLGTVTTASSNAVPAGNVISESPVAGTMVSSGSAVNLVVSSGSPVVPNVVSFSVQFGSQAYNVSTSTRIHLPWEINGVRVVFSEPITNGSVASIAGVTGTGFSGLGTNTLTWSINPVPLGNLAVVLSGSGINALTDAAGNGLGGGAGFTQALKILWGDFDDDGVVSAADLVDVNNATKTTYNVFADMNGDGVVNLADVQIVRLRAGTSLP